MRGFRAVGAVRDEAPQGMSPNERMQYIQTRFREEFRIVHAIDYAMGNFSRYQASLSGRFIYRSISAPADLSAVARIVRVGFPEPFCGKHDPPMTHRFGTCQ